MKARFVLVVVVLVLTAGCLTGGSGGVPESDGAGGDGGDGGAGDGDAGDGATGDGGDSSDGDAPDSSDGGEAASGEWEPFAFDTPARYEYDVFIEGDGEGTIVWDVESVDDGEYTVTLVYEMGDERYESTATGTKDTVVQQFFTNPGGIVLVTTMSQPAIWYEGRDLTTGTKWSYSTPQGSASFAVTGTDTYAGVDCWTSEMKINESVFHEACFSPDLGLAPYAAYYGEDGTLEMSLTLVSYEEN